MLRIQLPDLHECIAAAKHILLDQADKLVYATISRKILSEKIGATLLRFTVATKSSIVPQYSMM